MRGRRGGECGDGCGAGDGDGDRWSKGGHVGHVG